MSEVEDDPMEGEEFVEYHGDKNGENVDEEEGNIGSEDENKANENDQKKAVKPKRVVLNPQPKLNEQTLKGPRGIEAIAGYFDRVKFKGRGYEEQDLNVLLKTYEYWCHRLFPKFPFDACITKLEKLGAKRPVQNQLTRIRMDMNFDDNEEDKNLQSDCEDDPKETNDTPFDSLLAASNAPAEPEVTDEMLERMRINREKALQLREQRLKAAVEKATKNVLESNKLSEKQNLNESLKRVSQKSNENDVNMEEVTVENISRTKSALRSDSEEESIRISPRKKKTISSDNEEQEDVPKPKRKHVIDDDSSEDEVDPNPTSNKDSLTDEEDELDENFSLKLD